MQQDEIGELKRITKERRAYLRKLDDELLIVDLREQLTRYHREKQLNPNRNLASPRFATPSWCLLNSNEQSYHESS